ncbi:MAG: M20 aminoacylase family protein [Rhizobiaceae bacterium]
MPVINSIAADKELLTGWRRHLHQNPELGFECHQTSDFVAARLQEFGVDEIHRGIAKTGIVSIIRGKSEGRAIGLRADMDALPILEQTGVPYASSVPGRMHACGHDGHTTMLLGAARYLAQTRNFAGTAVLIFQPAEEAGGGGGVMCDEGIMDRFDISEVYALHTAPGAATGTFRTRSGPLMAAVDDFFFTVRGLGGHAALPHLTRDPVPAALALGQAVHTLVSRNTDPVDNLVVSLTMISAGTATNVIPETATLAGTVRSFNPQTRLMARDRLQEMADGIGAAMGVEITLELDISYPATINPEAETGFAVSVAREIVGEGAVEADCPPEMGSEDFAYMLEQRPGCYLFLGQGDGPQVHHPAFNFNDEILPVGASFFARIMERSRPAV